MTERERVDPALAFPEVNLLRPRDKAILTIAPIYFYLKYMRRKGPDEGLLENAAEQSDPIAMFREYMKFQDDAHSDTSGKDAAGEILASHPLRDRLYPELSGDSLSGVLNLLDENFEIQRFCDFIDDYDPYDETDPLVFAFDNASNVLGFLDGLGVRQIDFHGYRGILPWNKRQAIMEHIVAERFGNSGGFAKMLESSV